MTNDLVNNARSALMSRTILPESLDQPSWVDGGGQYPAAEILAAKNGLLHVPSYLSGNGALLPPTARLFNGMALDYDIDLVASPQKRGGPVGPPLSMTRKRYSWVPASGKLRVGWYTNTLPALNEAASSAVAWQWTCGWVASTWIEP